MKVNWMSKQMVAIAKRREAKAQKDRNIREEVYKEFQRAVRRDKSNICTMKTTMEKQRKFSPKFSELGRRYQP